MDLRSGMPYHWIYNGLPFSYPLLENNDRCTALVIGGGITGALCAHAISSAGIDVLVLEAGSIGTKSTSASTALLQYELDTPLHMLAESVGIKTAVRSYQLCAKAIDQIMAIASEVGPCGAQFRQSVQYATRRRDVVSLKKEHLLRQQHGFETDLLSSRELKDRFGLRKSGALVSHKAAEIDPYRLTHMLFQDVIKRGGRVMDRTQMKEFRRSENGFEIETEDGHRVKTDHLIMATGYESQRYVNEPGIELHSTYAIASQRIDMAELWHRNALIWETATPYLYLRTTPDGRALIGGLDEPFRNPGLRDKLLERKVRKLEKAFHKLFPDVPFTTEYTWCGTFGGTKDGLPYIDRDPKTGAWFVLGMGG
ncbi:MAG: FAD-dependent oxidoreductase, partial [Flavobacteriales bacterium]